MKSEFSIRIHGGKLVPISLVHNHAELCEFASTALTIKLVELEAACLAEEQASINRARLKRECDMLIDAFENASQEIRKII
jgi:hypothetical protein